ncbi:MAG: hypothetical protein Dasosvirus9_13 [Dasosvirus sp.]|uniref:Uncharacterized protein n=1 Tax=Dasosvirus sp. TaxID=2487764 RepID=A0A3G4ZVW6_9VIRU|nr:MAG: hypothetical protein Dasosvirus9_13 [Dasosvirus sp.]
MNSRWNSTEKLKLIDLYSQGKTYDEIGKELDRSGNAIKLRLESIVYDNLVRGQTVDILAKRLKSTEENIIQMYYSYKSFLEGRGKEVAQVDLTKRSHAIKRPSIKNNIFIGNDSKKKNIKSVTKNTSLERIEKQNRVLRVVFDNLRMKRAIEKLRKNHEK